jgi:hypothetical protein
MPTSITTLAALTALAAAATFAAPVLAATTADTPKDNDEPKIASYSVDIEAKLLSDRRNRGISDSFNNPGAQVTITAAHESGIIGLLEIGSVSKVVFPEGNRLLVLGATGYRWGNHDGWHYGVGIAREWFPGAKAIDAPTGFDETFTPTGTVTTNFNTTYGVFEFGYKLLEARYLYVLSEDLRGNNTAVLCGSAYLPQVLAGGDPSKAIACYNQGFKHSGGSHLLDFDIKYPIAPKTKLTAHLGYQKTHNFRDADLLDYKFGVLRSEWGFDFGAEVVGAKLRNRDLAIVTDTNGHSKRLDQTALLLTVGKKF